MTTTYVLIDYENVQPDNLALLDGKSVEVYIFLGVNQKKLDADTVQALQPLGKRVHYIRMLGSGPNALDFHIAFYVGELAHHAPKGTFYIISKDKGFDPLIAHLKSRAKCQGTPINIERRVAIAALTSPKAPKALSPVSPLDIILTSLKDHPKNRPRKVATLRNHIHHRLSQKTTSDELDGLLVELTSAGHILIDGNNVSYKIPPAIKR